jgi:hypothetical protein
MVPGNVGRPRCPNTLFSEASCGRGFSPLLVTSDNRINPQSNEKAADGSEWTEYDNDRAA